jgi:DNA-directed RNA polymerase specialized sigma24 family protein
MMQRVEGLSQKQIAQQLGISVETVQTQVAKGMRLLAQALSGRRATVTTEARRHNFLKRQRDAR